MANKKETSIYSDRGTIGSPEELDKYGVWVKSEPQDLSSIDLDYQELPEKTDLEMDAVDFGEDLSAGEDLTEFDSFFDPENLPALENTDDLADFDINLPEETFSAELQDFDLPPEPGEDPLTPDFTPSLEDLPEFEGPGENTNLSGEFFPELETPLGKEDFDLEGIPQDDMTISFGTDDSFTDSLETEGESPGDTGFEVIESDDFIPEPPLADVSMEDFLDSTLGSVPPLLNDPPVEAPFAEGPQEEEGAVSRESSLSTQLLRQIAEELSSIKREISTLKEEFSALYRSNDISRDVPKKDTAAGFFNEGADEGEDNEKIALTGDEINTILNTADFTEEASADFTEEAGADFTENLPEELSLGEDAPEDAGPAAFSEISFEEFPETPEKIPPEPVLAAPVEGTGDTEPEEAAEDFGGTGLEAGPEKLEILELPELEDDFSDIELLDIPGDSELPPEEEFPPLPEGEPEELKMLREEGVEPVIEASEDTSYLEEDPLGTETFDEDVLDLSDAVIDEPNISGNLVENALEEPSLDSIAVDLNLEDPLNLEVSRDAPFEDEPLEVLPEEEIGDLFIEDEDTVELFHEDDNITIDIALEEPAVAGEDLGPELLPEEEEVGEDFSDDFPAIEEALDLSPEPLPEEAAASIPEGPPGASGAKPIPDNLKQELKVVLSYMDQLLEALPDEKIEEFAQSAYFDTYKKLFEELGLI
jgi:hypothetical protein